MVNRLSGMDRSSVGEERRLNYYFEKANLDEDKFVLVCRARFGASGYRVKVSSQVGDCDDSGIDRRGKG